jgi:hypothetical protein
LLGHGFGLERNGTDFKRAFDFLEDYPGESCLLEDCAQRCGGEAGLARAEVRAGLGSAATTPRFRIRSRTAQARSIARCPKDTRQANDSSAHPRANNGHRGGPPSLGDRRDVAESGTHAIAGRRGE